HFDRAKAFGQRGGDFLGMPRSPDAGAVNTTAAAVQEDAVHHQINVLFPIVHFIIAEQYFAEAWTVDLHARIALVAFDGFGAAENFGALAAVDHFSAHFARAGINADRLAG